MRTTTKVMLLFPAICFFVLYGISLIREKLPSDINLVTPSGTETQLIEMQEVIWQISPFYFIVAGIGILVFVLSTVGVVPSLPSIRSPSPSNKPIPNPIRNSASVLSMDTWECRFCRAVNDWTDKKCTGCSSPRHGTKVVI